MSEKQYKPVPDVECLKYHGTPDKPDIKIFVSHRIDLDSETIDNPLYIPVRCGAVYDEREDVTMLGDDTGDNISEKRESFCEYTVMYWAWKNVNADYYGLCHYRRYLSFLNDDVPGAALRQGLLDSMSKAQLERCGLTDVMNIRTKILKSDMTVPYEYTLKEAGVDPQVKTIKEFWLKDHRSYLRHEDFDNLLRLIKKYAPEYHSSAVEYTRGDSFYGFNCFVMKRDLFFKMCEFMFPIMFEFDRSLDKSNYSTTQMRAVGYLGEWLFSIFIYHIKKNGTISVLERQIVAFQNTEKTKPLMPIQTNEAVTIVFSATDENRAMIGVQIKSIMVHAHKNNFYDFIILHRSYDEDKWRTHLLKEDDETVRKIVGEYENASVRFYDPKSELDRLELRDFGERNYEEMLYVIVVPWVLENYDKVIYMQDGMLAQTDVAELLQEDISSCCVGAVKDIFFGACLNGYVDGFRELSLKKLKLSNYYNYVSIDILLFNLKRIRETFKKANIFSMLESQLEKLNVSDIFNELYDGEVKFLSRSWNRIECWGPDYFTMLEYFPAENISKQIDDQTNVVNIRGANGVYLPAQSWVMKFFWKYARMTPFYEQWLLASSDYGAAIFDLRNRMGLFDHRTGARKFADKLLPKGTRRREFAKLLLPKGSLRWRFCKQVYYIFRPKYRPKKEADIEDTVEEDED